MKHITPKSHAEGRRGFERGDEVAQASSVPPCLCASVLKPRVKDLAPKTLSPFGKTRILRVSAALHGLP